MGLDMYVSFTKEEVTEKVDFSVNSSNELHRWRKHPNLHGWMEELYYEKGGTQEFNCVTVVIELEDLVRLEKAIIAGALPTTEGFFFGQSTGDEQDDDIEFVKKACNAIQYGYTVFYASWW